MDDRPGTTAVGDALRQKVRDRLNYGPEGPGRGRNFGKLWEATDPVPGQTSALP